MQITKKFPYPVIDGEVMAINNLTSGFAALHHTVTVLSLNTQKHYFELKNLPRAQKLQARYIAVDIDTRVKAADAFLNLFSSRSYNIERFWSADFERKVIEILSSQQFDLILLETIYPMRYIKVIRKHSRAKVVLRPHNVEWQIWERLQQKETNPLKKFYLKLLATRMKRFELEHINKADLLLPVSVADMQVFIANGSKLPYLIAPIGYNLAVAVHLPATEENAVAFIGSLDYMPNREGIEWFIKNVWPKVVEQQPDAKFYLAGRNFPDDIRTLRVPGLVIVGEVENAAAFVASKSISVVPLFAGSGMRVKIIEAMALGRAIVATTVGAEGINYTNGSDIVIADDSTAFANAIVENLRDTDMRKHLGANAKQLINKQYNNHNICSAIIEFCKPYL